MVVSTYSGVEVAYQIYGLTIWYIRQHLAKSVVALVFVVSICIQCRSIHTNNICNAISGVDT